MKKWTKRGHFSTAGSLSLCVLLALLYAGVTYLRIIPSIGYTVEDRFYQEMGTPDSHIVVVEITMEDMQRFPAWAWDRSALTQVIQRLNQEPEQRPAAIGIDIVLSSETGSEWDEALAEVCRQTGNVVTACRAVYDSKALSGGADRSDTQMAERIIRPYRQLAAATLQGHNNIVCDFDGTVRRHLWRAEEKRGNEMYSLAEQLYRLYCGYHGEEETFEPQLTGNFWYVRYTAQLGAYRTYSLSDIVDGRYDPADVAGCIVLLGSSLVEEGENYTTSIARAQRMHNVEYQANVVDAMLNHKDMKVVSDGTQTLVIFLVITAFSFFLFHSAFFPGVCVYTALVIAGAALAEPLKNAGYMVHPMWLTLQASASMILALIVHYVREREGQRKMLNLFQRYLDPVILDDLMNGDSSTAFSNRCGHHADVAVLFVDIRGFTALTEKVVPEGVVDILNRYLTMTSTCVQQNGGTVDKFVGDCTMAIWGAVRPCKDAVWQACRAAMDMVGQMDTLSRAVEKEYGCKLAYGVGVHYGDAIVGNIGSEVRMDYTAIGDVVNTASRIEAMAPAGSVYVSGKVREMLGDRVTVGQQVGRITLKGKSDSIDIYEIKELSAMMNAIQNQFTQEIMPTCIGLLDASGRKNTERFPNLSPHAKTGLAVKELRDDMAALAETISRINKKKW